MNKFTPTKQRQQRHLNGTEWRHVVDDPLQSMRFQSWQHKSAICYSHSAYPSRSLSRIIEVW